MKEEMITVTIEETVSQNFKIPKRYEQNIDQLYKDGKLVLEPGELQSAQYMITYENGEQTSWEEI